MRRNSKAKTPKIIGKNISSYTLLLLEYQCNIIERTLANSAAAVTIAPAPGP
jgi:hypothetical protein